MQLTAAHRRILNHQFHEFRCPVCSKKKQCRECFCRTCYFALKSAAPQLAAGLYVQYPSDEFYENYARAKEWLEERGHSAGWNSTPKSGDLFA